MDICVFCGEPLVDGKCEKDHTIKKMCVNCKFSEKNEDGSYTCKNEKNLNTTKDKMLEAIKNVSEAYAVKEFEIDPLPLKKPMLKCKEWSLDDSILDKLFV